MTTTRSGRGPGPSGAAADPAADPGTDAPGQTDGVGATQRRRFVLVLISLGLVVVAFRQAGDRQVPDTKLDLVEAPGQWLASALGLWDAGGSLGQLQNQAYGYLFPMGPYFWLADVTGTPHWVAQRGWWSLLLVLAFLGLVRLASTLGLGSLWTQAAGGLVYALSPRIMSELGTISVESWPVALAPWVLVPLVRPRSQWAAAAASGVAVLAMGGVNAAATAAAVLPAGLWVLTRSPGRTAVALGWRWVVAVTATTSWWLVPLFLLGRYSPPFLDWIEDAAVTTRAASGFEAVRGTTHWLGYLADADGPVWPVAWSLVSSPWLVVNTAVVAGVGLAGVTLAPSRHRGFLALLLTTGVLGLTLGHTGPGTAPWAPALQDVLDGPLAPLRNTHKFDVVVRLALCLGVAQALSRWRVPVPLSRTWSRRSTATVVVIACLGAVAPAAVGALGPRGGFEQVPDAWRQTASWLDAVPDPGAVLVLPGAGRAEFTWGTTADEPLQALMSRPLVVRSSVPLGGPGSTRLVDAWQALLESGRGDEAVAESLRRAGIGFVVLRADLAASTGAPPPLVVREGLVRAGLVPQATFGPPAGSPSESAAATLDDRLLQAVPTVEVFAVPGQVEAVQLLAATGTVRATGGPEDTLRLARELGPERAVLMGADGAAVPDPDPVVVLTDGLRKRETFFGRSRDQQSRTLAVDEEGELGRRVREPLPDDDPALASTARLVGIRTVQASSSAADAAASLRLGPGTGPWAAVDGRPQTRWVSGDVGEAAGGWLEVVLGSRVAVDAVTVAFDSRAPVGAGPVRVRVRTDSGEVTVGVPATDAPQQLPLPTGPTTRIRVTVDQTAPGPQNGVGIAELVVPGVTARRTLDLADPSVLGTAPDVDAVLLEAAPGSDGCLLLGTRPLCSPTLERDSEDASGLDRTLTTGGVPDPRTTGTVRAVPGPGLDALLDALAGPGPRIRAQASSVWTRAAASRPGTAVDRDLGTGWVAGSDDLVPRLVLSLPQPRRVGAVQLLVDGALAASRPTRVRVDAGAGPQEVGVDERGYVRFEATVTDRVSVELLDWQRVRSTDAASGLVSVLPPGVSEVRVIGADDLRRARSGAEVVAARCGTGPTLTVAGRAVPTQVVGTYAQVLADEPLDWRPCGRAPSLPPGRVEVLAPATSAFRPASLKLSNAPTPTPQRPSDSTVLSVEPDRPDLVPERVVLTSRERPQLLVLAQNASDGWSARLEGVELQSVRVDGWRQGWLVPAGGTAAIDVEFRPQRAYTAALLVGGAAAACLVVVAALLRRRPRRAEHARTGPTMAVSPRVATAVSASLLVAAVGPPAVAALLGVAALVAGWSRWRRRPPRAVLVRVVLGAWTAATGLALLSLWPAEPAAVESQSVQLFAAVTLAGVVVGVLGPRRAARSTGASSHR